MFRMLSIRPHLGVSGKITGSVGSADLPNIITAVGPYKTAHIVGCLHHRELLEGSMDFDLLPKYFGNLFDMEFAKKLAIEAFEEDTGLKVGSVGLMLRIMKTRRAMARISLGSQGRQRPPRKMMGSWERQRITTRDHLAIITVELLLDGKR